MKGLAATLGVLAAQFALLSLLAFGGVNTVVPEIHRSAVDVHHWMSDRDFANYFAIAHPSLTNLSGNSWWIELRHSYRQLS